MPKNDEFHFALRDGMANKEILEEIEKVGKIVHRLAEISLGAGLLMISPVVGTLFNVGGAIAALVVGAQQQEETTGPKLYRPS